MNCALGTDIIRQQILLDIMIDNLPTTALLYET